MEYTFSKTGVSPEKIQTYSKLLSAVFPETDKYTPAFLNWQYNQNPSGKVIGYDAYFNDELIAHYVALPAVYIYEGEKVKGLLALNVATREDHRGKGLFTRLAAMTYAYGEESGFRFVTGVANQNTSDGYIKRLGFKIVAPLDVHIFSGRLKAGRKLDEYFREEWTEEKRNWRLKNPEAVYYRNGNCVLSKTHIGPIHAILSERQEFTGAQLPSKTSLLKMAIGLNLSNSERALKISLPDRFKPSPLHLIFKTLGDFKMEVDRNNTFFELMDFDAY
jgi:GNAT superfamily N-acetyltransferase